MHFGVLHLVFNLLWLWVFGRQIEAIDGGWRFALVVVLSGVAANLAQYATGSVLFGGLSGIDFAVIGYVFIAARRRPALGYQMQRSLMIFMLISGAANTLFMKYMDDEVINEETGETFNHPYM